MWCNPERYEKYNSIDWSKVYLLSDDVLKDILRSMNVDEECINYFKPGVYADVVRGLVLSHDDKADKVLQVLKPEIKE